MLKYFFVVAILEEKNIQNWTKQISFALLRDFRGF